MILSAVAFAAVLSVLRTVVAQAPVNGTPTSPKVSSTSGLAAKSTVRPYSEWTPTPPGSKPLQVGSARSTGSYLPPPAGYSRQQPTASYPDSRPRLTSPVMAGGDGVRPVSLELPPPSMELPGFQPGVGAASGSLPPPSVTVEPQGRDNTVPAVPPLDGNPTVPPLGSGGPIPPAPLAPPSSTPIVPVLTPPPSGLPSGEGTQTRSGVSSVGMSNDAGSSSMLPMSNPSTGVATGFSSKTTQSVTVEAVCPETIVFGQEYRYELVVRNTGGTTTMGVRVEDEVPVSARFISSDPPAEYNGDRLVWNLGQLDPSGEKRIVVRLKPSDEGELQSRATVTYTTAVAVRTRVTRPRIAVIVTGPEVCRVGEETTLSIKVSNTGTGPAQRMILQADLAEGLIHPQGRKIEAELTHLPAGESKVVPLKLMAGKAGLQQCQITVAVEGSSDATARASINVVEPLLHLTQSGPTKCLVRGEPVYELTLANPGTATTDPITMYTVLPEGFEFIQASDQASYNPTNRAVAWKLGGLAPGASRTVTVKLRAIAAADGSLRTIAQATPEQAPIGQAGVNPARQVVRPLEAKTETAIKSEGVAAVRFEVIDLEDPVEVGKEAVYEIRVTNQGTGICSNIQLVAALGEGTVYTGSSGPTQIKVQGQHLVFEPIPTLAVKGEVVYRVRVKGTLAGEARFRVQLTSDQVRTPVIKEESTRFYQQ